MLIKINFHWGLVLDPRITATKVLGQVLQNHHSLGAELEQIPKDNAPLVKELSYGVMRYLPRLELLATRLLKKPFREKDYDLYCLLLIGFYQLFYTRIPEHAALSETVECTKRLKKDWSAGLFNAILRNCLRQREALTSQLDSYQEAKYCHPEWLITLIEGAYPDQWQTILQENQQRSPMTLRINTVNITHDEYSALLEANNIEAEIIPEVKNAIVLDKPCSVENLPGFYRGLVSVQDASAQLAARFLDVAPGQRVLDACAAPGGKTTHLLEMEPEIQELVAVDHEEKRLPLIHENLSRLALEATVKLADASDPDSWWDGVAFDRILLDAPCSAMGVIRRHPDIKYLRKKSDIKQLSDFQFQLLNNLWPLLKRGGLLLYVTCSILPEENDQVVKKFISNHDTVELAPIHFSLAEKTDCGIQLLPQKNFDGFYFSLLRKI